MNKPTLRAALAALLTAPLAALAAGAVLVSATGTVKSYVACPVYRDTDAGRKSGCWLTTQLETGERFDVSNSLNRPYIGRLVLVEGVVSNGKDICGGAVLEPVRVSVLPDACPELTIPAEGYPSKPTSLPPEIVMPLEVPRKMPPPPYDRREFHVYFDYGDDFLTYQHGDVAVEKTWAYVTAAKARRVEVTGYADTVGIRASGRDLKEPAELAAARAEMVAEALRRLGVPESTLSIRSATNPQPVLDTPGMRDVSRRRVTVTVTP